MGKASLRREGIMQMLREKGTITVNEIVSLYRCSEATARRDLEMMESEKKLIRTYGGAILEETKHEIPFFNKLEQEVAAKQEIAAKAADLIQDGDVIGLSGGSTTYFIAKKIRDSKKVTVVTNAINIAYELAGVEGIQLIVTGGVLRSQSFELSGPMADSTLSKIIIQKMFVGADGISLHRGMTTFNELEANTNRLMLEHAQQRYVVVDHTKFNNTSLFVIFGLKDVNAILTDGGVSKQIVKQYRDAGITIL